MQGRFHTGSPGGSSLALLTPTLTPTLTLIQTLRRAVNTRNHWRPPFPSLTSGEEKRFDDAGMLSAKGPYVQSQRMAWAPFFAVARCGGPGIAALIIEPVFHPQLTPHQMRMSSLCQSLTVSTTLGLWPPAGAVASVCLRRVAICAQPTSALTVALIPSSELRLLQQLALLLCCLPAHGADGPHVVGLTSLHTPTRLANTACVAA